MAAPTAPIGPLAQRFIDFTKDETNRMIGFPWKNITVLFLGDSPVKAGTMAVTIDGDDLGGNNTLDLATETSLDCSGTRAYCHITIAGFPTGQTLRVFFRE